MLLVLSLALVLKQNLIIELINGRRQTNRDQKSNLLFLQPHNQSQRFWIKLVKNRQKNITNRLIFTTLDISQLKINDCESIYSVNAL